MGTPAETSSPPPGADVGGEVEGTSAAVARGLVVRAVVVALGVALAVWMGLGAVRAARTGVDAAAARNDPSPVEQLTCVRAAIAAAVPAGARVHVGDQAASGRPDWWHQRLIQLAFPHAVAVADPAEAAFALDIVPAAPGADPGCQGLVVVATPT